MFDKSIIDPYYFSTEWRRLRAATLKRDGHICQYCGLEAYQADHVIPRKKGGPDHLSNLVACCPDCNFVALNHKFASFAEKRSWIRSIRIPFLRRIRSTQVDWSKRVKPAWYAKRCRRVRRWAKPRRIPLRLRAAALKRDHTRCVFCQAECHRVAPVSSKLDIEDPRNLLTVCNPCERAARSLPKHVRVTPEHVLLQRYL